jgi:hypothetical protein
VNVVAPDVASGNNGKLCSACSAKLPGETASRDDDDDDDDDDAAVDVLEFIAA